jgi:hypothetical protein
VNISLRGGAKKDKLRVWIKFRDVEEKTQVWLLKKQKDCFQDLCSKVNEELRHDHWIASFEGKEWVDNTRIPDDGTLILIKVEDGYPGPGPHPTIPVPKGSG